MAIWLKDTRQPQALPALQVKLIYNFTYRLSGSREVAAILTEKMFLRQASNHNSAVMLLKQAWEDFLKHYSRHNFTTDNPLHQALLSLAPEPRGAVILRDILGYSYGQIATILNKSDLEVGKLIATGRQGVRQAWKN